MARELSQMKIRSILPMMFGISIGFALSMVYIPIVEQFCLYDIAESSNRQHDHLKSMASQAKDDDQRSFSRHGIHPSPTPVLPRKSQFNYDFRPYFIYSELGFRFKLIVAVLTSESRLENYAVAINNTWAQNLPKVVFFTPYSKNINFHEKYNRQLNLNVVQLPDVGEDSSKTDLLFKVVQYLKDHYSSNYNLFMRIDDNAYVNSEQLFKFINTVNSTEDLYIGYSNRFPGRYTFEDNRYWKDWRLESYCVGNSGLIFSRSVLLKLATNLNTCVKMEKEGDDNYLLEKCVRKTVGIGCTSQKEVCHLTFQ